MRLVVVVTVIAALHVTAHPTELQQPARYDNYSVYKVHIQNPEQRQIINSLLDQPDKVTRLFTNFHSSHNPFRFATNQLTKQV